jgi:hypothetical protein
MFITLSTRSETTFAKDVKIAPAQNRIIVVRRSAPKDKPDLARLKDNAKFALVAIETKHPDIYLSDANWAGQPKRLGQKAYCRRIDLP